MTTILKKLILVAVLIVFSVGMASAETIRVVILVQNMRHQRSEARAEVPQPGNILFQLRNDDGHVITHGLFNCSEILIAQQFG